MRSFLREHRLLGPVVLMGACTVGLAVVWAAYTWITWPDVPRLASERPDTTAFMQRYLDRRAADPALAPLRRQWVPFSEISVHVKRAVVCAEDLEFFRHQGFSASETKAAIRELFDRGRLRGASTITQQLAKNLWLSPSRNPLRKVREALLTRALEKHLSKNRILEIYLNVVEFGPGLYGVGAAAPHYFGKSAGALSERESAMLAASLPRPATWHPGVESRAYAGYVNEILGRMEGADFLWRYVGDPTGAARPDPSAAEGLPFGDSLSTADEVAGGNANAEPDTALLVDSDRPLDSIPESDPVPAIDSSPPGPAVDPRASRDPPPV